MSAASQSKSYDYDVIVAGAGPVGLSLTIDLGRRGVNCMILERDPSTAPWPKMDRSNQRTMEIYRRMGIVDRVRALGYPADNPMDVILAWKAAGPLIAVQKYPSVAERREMIAESTDGSWPLEPYQLVAQNDIEPLLREVATNETPNTTVRYGLELIGFEQDDDGVTVTAKRLDGEVETFRCRYLAGTDGGASTVRKILGIRLQGRAALQETRHVIFWSEKLYELMGKTIGKGRHYGFLGGKGVNGLIAQGGRKEFTAGTQLPADTDFEPLIRDMLGFGDEVDIEIRHVNTWRLHLLLAEKYRTGRVFLAGDAAHLVIPTGGLGMNSGVGDAIDLGWKLAGVVNGWGGPGLLDAYEQERRPVGMRNVEVSGWASDGANIYGQTSTPLANQETPEGLAARQRMVHTYFLDQSRMHNMVGAETNYSYAGSPLVAHEPGNLPIWEINKIVPHGRPGVRIPHMWLKDGTALQDNLGPDYTLLDLVGDCDTSGIEAAFKALGAPLEVKRMDEPRLREVYNGSVFLLRPDLHIAWRGDAPPADPKALAAMATGNGPRFRP